MQRRRLARVMGRSNGPVVKKQKGCNEKWGDEQQVCFELTGK